MKGKAKATGKANSAAGSAARSASDSIGGSGPSKDDSARRLGLAAAPAPSTFSPPALSDETAAAANDADLGDALLATDDAADDATGGEELPLSLALSEEGGSAFSRGVISYRLTVQDDRNGQHLGFIDFSFCPKESYQKLYPTVWHFMAMAQGWHGVDPDAPLRPLWTAVGDYAEPLDYAKKMEVDGPVDEAKMRADLERWEQRYASRRGNFAKFHVDRPLVRYAYVDASFRGIGIAGILYSEAADWLAKNYRLPLHASSFQTQATERIWARLEREGASIVGPRPLAQPKKPSPNH